MMRAVWATMRRETTTESSIYIVDDSRCMTTAEVVYTLIQWQLARRAKIVENNKRNGERERK